MFEAHVTVDPMDDEKRQKLFTDLCGIWRFRPAKLFMRKDGRDTAHKDDYFATGHADVYENMCSRLRLLCIDLKAAGIRVRRYKIERIELDSRNGDPWGLL